MFYGFVLWHAVQSNFTVLFKFVFYSIIVSTMSMCAFHGFIHYVDLPCERSWGVPSWFDTGEDLSAEHQKGPIVVEWRVGVILKYCFLASEVASWNSRWRSLVCFCSCTHDSLCRQALPLRQVRDFHYVLCKRGHLQEVGICHLQWLAICPAGQIGLSGLPINLWAGLFVWFARNAPFTTRYNFLVS